jgi:non-specific serine/threonine protein kinase
MNATRLLGLTSELLESVGFRFDPWDRELYDGYVAAARKGLGEEGFGKAWAEGRAMSMEQAIEYVQGVDAPWPARREVRGAAKDEGTASEAGVLTRREREVAVLISQGKTNRLIGEELVVSERTVEGHVNNILTKLGFRSRAQISAWAVGKGLVKLRE